MYLGLELFLFYLALLAVLYVFQANFVFVPNQADAFLEETPPWKNLVSTTGDLSLPLKHKWAAAADKNKLTIVLFHGNAGNVLDRTYKANQLLANGYGFAITGYRGYGGNPGKPSEQGLYRDAQSLIETLKNLDVPVENMVFYGESLGTGVAVEMAKRFPQAAGLVLETPFDQLASAARRKFWFVPVDVLLKHRFNSKAKIKDIHMPLLVLHGNADETVPYESGQRLFDAANQPKQMITIEGGKHNNLYDYGVADKVLQFVQNLPKAKTP